MKIVYIAGPYTGKTHDYRSYFEIERNIGVAAEAAAWLVDNGYGYFCPHLHSRHFEVITPEVGANFWYTMDLKFLDMCDALLLVGDWLDSKGALAEKDRALGIGIPVFYNTSALLEGLDAEGD